MCSCSLGDVGWRERVWEVPVGATVIFGAVNRFSAWLDQQMEPVAQKRLTQYLKSGSWVTDSESIFLSIRRPLNILLGTSLSSWRGFKRSAQLTLLITLPIVVYYYIWAWAPIFWGSAENALNKPGLLLSEMYYYLIRYSMPKLLVAVVLDYFSLLRVRLIVRHLSKPNLTLWRIIACLLGEVLVFIGIYYIAWQIFSAFENIRSWSVAGVLEMLRWEKDNQSAERVLGELRSAILMRDARSSYFYAGCAPSIYLLGFVASVCIVKIFHRLSPVLRNMTSTFTFDKPILFVGNLVGCTLAIIFAFGVWVTK